MKSEIKIMELMQVFDLVDSSLRRMLSNGDSPVNWLPEGEAEINAFGELIAARNRKALKDWYARLPAINPAADVFREILEDTIGEKLPLGSSKTVLEK